MTESDGSPDEFPFGQTHYLNYDPDQVNSIEDVAELLEWLAGQNEERDETTAAAVYRDAAEAIHRCLTGFQEDNNE